MTFAVADHPAKLVFNVVLVIVGGGAVDLALLARLYAEGAAIIAADGGAHACRSAGIMPEAIVGDMDSLDSGEKWPADTRIIALDEQDTTDFEKCLYMTEAPLTLALGMTGGRFDHTLASLDVVARYASHRHVILVDAVDVALALCGGISFAVAAGDRVSVHPLQSVRFETSVGLKYPLDGLTLAPGVKTGTSNQATEGAFSITPAHGAQGAWLMIVDWRYLPALVKKFMQPLVA